MKPLRQKSRHLSQRVFIIIGMISTMLFIVGLAIDLSKFDTTSGGYEYPYEGRTGTPIDYDTFDVTDEGFALRGHVINGLINCTNGMISIERYKREIPFRVLSLRALKVHKPREACIKQGFLPEF